MSVARWMTGDVFERMAEIPEGSVDLIVTSPPFLALRSYLPADHPDKAKEIGSEPTPAAFLSTLLALTREWRRILAPHGSIAVELGDTYSGAGGYGNSDAPNPAYGQPRFEERWTGRTAKRFKKKDDGWPLAKSLCLLPELYPASLAYGRNLLDPDDTIEPWRIRNKIVWHRPNPPVGALGDKVRPSTSYITTACVSDKRWFDLDAERTEAIDQRHRTTNGPKQGDPAEVMTANYQTRVPSNAAGAPPLDCWTIPTQPYKGSHYATFPIALPRRLIRLMCPMWVCVVCGEPRRRINADYTLDAYRNSKRPQTVKAVALADAHGLTDEHVAAVRAFGTSDAGKAPSLNNGAGRNSEHVKKLAAEAKAVLGGYFREFVMGTNASISHHWTNCGHDNYRRGIVCDPFAGSGTTLAAAVEQGRDAIGIDLDDRNLDLARERIGLFLEESA